MNLRSIEWSGVKKKKQDTKIIQQNYHGCKTGKMHDGNSLYFQEIHLCMQKYFLLKDWKYCHKPETRGPLGRWKGV